MVNWTLGEEARRQEVVITGMPASLEFGLKRFGLVGFYGQKRRTAVKANQIIAWARNRVSSVQTLNVLMGCSWKLLV